MFSWNITFSIYIYINCRNTLLFEIWSPTFFWVVRLVCLVDIVSEPWTFLKIASELFVFFFFFFWAWKVWIYSKVLFLEDKMMLFLLLKYSWFKMCVHFRCTAMCDSVVFANIFIYIQTISSDLKKILFQILL